MTTATLRRTTSTADALVTRLADALSVPDGGFSINRRGLEPSAGFAVAVYPDREQQIQGRVTRADISAYLYANADVLVSTSVVAGGWRNPDDGVAYLDVSRVVETREEAAELARTHNQLAYFDLVAGVSVAV